MSLEESDSEQHWMIQAAMTLNNGEDFSEVLNARKQQLERCLSTVSIISWPACPDSGSENLGAQQYEGFVHDGSSNQIRMG